MLCLGSVKITSEKIAYFGSKVIFPLRVNFIVTFFLVELMV
jgi:hypothetical protein